MLCLALGHKKKEVHRKVAKSQSNVAGADNCGPGYARTTETDHSDSVGLALRTCRRDGGWRRGRRGECKTSSRSIV